MRVIFIAFAITFAALVSSAAAGQAAPAKTLVFCSQESPETFNPQLSASQTTFDASARQIYDRLVTYDPKNGEIVPALAESWQISDDGREYAFRLREGVSFHATRNFRPTRTLTANDVVFTFARQFNQRHPWHGVSGGDYPFFRGLGLDDLIESVTAIGELKVAFRLKRPNAAFLSVLAMDFASILSAEYAQSMAEAETPERFDREPVGTGPFKLAQYQRDALIRYVAHRQYWRGAAPLDNLVFAIIPDAGVRLQKLRNGECHVIEQPDPADLPTLLNDPQIVVIRQTAADLGFLAFNTEKPPLNDVRIRRALSLAIDRKAIVDRAYAGIGVAATDPLPPGARLGASGRVPPPPDPVRAREILSEIGQDSLSVDIWAIPASRPYMRSSRRVAEMVRDDWAAIGVEATITVPDWDTFLKHSMLGAHKTILFGWIGETLDPDLFLSPILTCEGAENGSNRSRWCDPAFDRLLTEARRMTGRAERDMIYGMALERLREQVPMVPLAHSVSLTPLRAEVVGYVASPLGGHDFYGVDLK